MSLHVAVRIFHFCAPINFRRAVCIVTLNFDISKSNNPIGRICGTPPSFFIHYVRHSVFFTILATNNLLRCLSRCCICLSQIIAIMSFRYTRLPCSSSPELTPNCSELEFLPAATESTRVERPPIT